MSQLQNILYAMQAYYPANKILCNIITTIQVLVDAFRNISPSNLKYVVFYIWSKNFKADIIIINYQDLFRTLKVGSTKDK